MKKNDQIVSSSIGQMLDRVIDNLEHGLDVAIVGPKGSGISSIGEILSQRLQDRGFVAPCLNCRTPGIWQEGLREICRYLSDSCRGSDERLILLIDHAGDLPPDQIAAIQVAASRWKAKTSVNDRTSTPGKEAGQGNDRYLRFRSQVWIGNLDCRTVEDLAGVYLATEPRFVFQIPEYNADLLLSLYSSLADRQESQWGEAILYMLLDWCGTDLALAESLGAHFYGNWRDSVLYEETVAECIGRWLKSDPLVAGYRQTFQQLNEANRGVVRLLNSGGKIPCHSPFCTQEPDPCIRYLYMSGAISMNLLPGFYQYRNLTVRLLALQSEPDAPQVDMLDLLRKHSNGRIAAVLQDAELSLRLLVLKCFSRIGYAAVRQNLMSTRTEEQAIPTDLRKSLMEWAKNTGGPSRLQELGKHLSQYQKQFEASLNLWTRICGLYASELGIELTPEIEPPLSKAVSYMTFGELSNLILSLETTAFPRWQKKEIGKDPPGKRWPGYMALLRRLRNQSAHLRNVAFQDTEDLLVAVREIRKDIQNYA